jgi:outer membrane protein TolC
MNIYRAAATLSKAGSNEQIRSKTRFRLRALSTAGLCATAFAAAAGAQSVSMYTVVDLALRNSPEVRMAEADVHKAAAGLAEAKDAYLPSFTFNSNIGYSYGFPVGQPSVLNAQANSLVLSLSQRQYVKAARAATDAARLSLKDARQKVILEAALDYIQLDTYERELAALKKQQESGDRLIAIEEDRVAAGVDSRVEATQARLDNARLGLRQLQVEGEVEVLAAKLAHLDGLPPANLTTDPTSIPAAPSAGMLALSVEQNFGVQAAYGSAEAKHFVARGDDRLEYGPLFAFGLNYSRYAEFNNYQEYYNRFQHNNFGIGLNITIPVFDETKRQHAKGSAAEAVHSLAEADLSRDQESEQELELEKNLKTLAAQQNIAALQQELAQEQLDTVAIQLQDGMGNSGATPVTPKQEQLARINAGRYAVDLLDANFQLLQAQLNLLRLKGLVELWATAPPKP